MNSILKSNAQIESSNSSLVKNEGTKPHSLITIQSEPDESMSLITDIVSPKETTPKKLAKFSEN